MLKIENVETYGWEAAIRGMRNPMNSWKLSDSEWVFMNLDTFEEVVRFNIGEKDLALMKKLVASGSDHSKFMRMIGVSLDVTAPLYWWKEFDTYKVGTVANSCSTMHKIHSKEFTFDDFSVEHLKGESLDFMRQVIGQLNFARIAFLESHDKEYWWEMIQLLPTSYNQMRTVTLNYAVLRNIYHARKNHKLDEWHVFCDWIKAMPYSELITT